MLSTVDIKRHPFELRQYWPSIDKYSIYWYDGATMNEVKRKQGESFDGMFRRFQRRVQSSGLQTEVRRRKHREDVKNRNGQRASKVRGLKIADKIHWMIRTGKATEADFSRRKKRRR